MTRRRKWAIRAATAVAAALAVPVLFPAPRAVVVGLACGESFHRGMPTRHWRQGLERANSTAYRLGVVEEPPWLVGKVRSLLRLSPKLPDDDPPPLIEAEPAAVPVLVDLLSDPDPLIRAFSARALGEIGPPAQAAVPALLLRLDDWACVTSGGVACGLDADGKLVGVPLPRLDTGGPICLVAAEALWKIDPEAAGAAGVRLPGEAGRVKTRDGP